MSEVRESCFDQQSTPLVWSYDAHMMSSTLTARV